MKLSGGSGRIGDGQVRASSAHRAHWSRGLATIAGVAVVVVAAAAAAAWRLFHGVMSARNASFCGNRAGQETRTPLAYLAAGDMRLQVEFHYSPWRLPCRQKMGSAHIAHVGWLIAEAAPVHRTGRVAANWRTGRHTH